MTGHKNQQSFFKQSFDRGRLSHAYLLTGPEGVGKKLFAKEFAKGLLCPNNSFFEQCGCNSCKQADEGVHPDYHVYEKDEEIDVDNVRRISEFTSKTAFGGGWRVVIIDNAHLLSDRRAESANALLKVLEEPGIDTVFFLVSHQLNRVLPTVKSRCVNVQFDPLSDAELAAILKNKDIAPEPLLPYAAGSVAMALTLEEIGVNKLLTSLERGEFENLGMQIFALNDTKKLSAAIHVTRSYYLSIYKRTLDPDIAVFLQYLDDTFRNINTVVNINISLVLLDFYIKLTRSIDAAGALK